MRRKISLYVKGKLVDVNDESYILFNYAFNDMTNPTVIKNSYSQKVTLPLTSANKRVFDHWGRLDRVTGTGFDVIKKEPFAIYSAEGALLQKGYVKLESVSSKGYEISLFGGCGSLFYGLSSKDGEPLTLADVIYPSPVGGEGEIIDKDTTFHMDLTRTFGYLETGQYSDEANALITFVPMYNGVPDDFNAKKALAKPNVYANLPLFFADGGKVYTSKDGVGGNYIINYADDKTEYEVQDLRCYLQRPAINVSYLLKGIEQSSYDLTGITLVIDPSVLAISDLSKMWLTLPMLKTEYRPDAVMTVGKILEDTISPCDALLAISKVLGLVFMSEREHIILMTRAKFFDTHKTDVIDLTKRIDTREIKVEPVVSGSHYYLFAPKGIGEVAQKALEEKGIEYGGVKVDTNYIFNDDKKDVLEGIDIKSCASTKHSSTSFITAYFKPDSTKLQAEEIYVPQTATEEVKATVYNGGESKEIPLTYPQGYVCWDSDVNGLDWTERLESEDEGKKMAEGDYLLVKYTEMGQSPSRRYENYADMVTVNFQGKRYYLTSWDDDRIAMNDGEDCWDVTHEGDSTNRIPMFECLYEMGENGLYARFWKDYITDLYDKDSLRMSCKADLSGMEVNDALLGRFYYYDGSIWVLNSIKNYSMTTYDSTECEFIRVKDMDNYTQQ